MLAPDELLARTGGDEFVVVSPAGALVMQATVARLRAACPPTVGVSAGMADWVPGSELDAALRMADRGVYPAKAAGATRPSSPRTTRPDRPGLSAAGIG